MRRKTKRSVSLKNKIKNNELLQIILKIFLSVFIVYHLTVIFVIPNSTSMVYEQLSPYVLPYGWTLRMATPWQFFSPDPADHYYFKYIVHYPNKIKKTFFWPPLKKESNLMFFNHLRLTVQVFYFLIYNSGRFIRWHFLPYICSLHTEAIKIKLKVMTVKKPTFKEARQKGYSFVPYRGGSVVLESSRLCRNKKNIRNINSLDKVESIDE